MDCLKCDGKTTTLDSRKTSYGIRRRRECLECKNRFTTVEIPAEEYISMLERLETLENTFQAAFETLCERFKEYLMKKEGEEW